MEVGDLKFTARIDNIDLNKGLMDIIMQMKKVDTTGQSVNADFFRMNATAVALGFALVDIGEKGVNALIGIAKVSPTLSGDLTKIQVSSQQLGFTLGNIVKPIMDAVSDDFQGFVQWIQNHQDAFTPFTSGITNIVNAFGDFFKIMDKIGSIKIPFLDVTIGDGLKWIFQISSDLTTGGIAAGLKAILDLLQGNWSAAAADITGFGNKILNDFGVSNSQQYNPNLTTFSNSSNKNNALSPGTYSSGGQLYSGTPNTNNLFQQSRKNQGLNMTQFSLGF